MTDRSADGSGGPSPLLLTLFVASGAAALVYQVAFARLFVTVFGATVLAASTVLAVFMGGFALGAALLGRFADRSKRPLLVYGVLEALVSLWCLGALGLFGGLRELYVETFAGAHASLASLTLARIGIATVLLLPPTFLMGGTLPYLAVHAIRRDAQVGKGIARLYSANTWGAAAGTLVTTFLLMSWLGVSNSVTVAAVVGLAVAAVAIVWQFKSGEREVPAASESDAPRAPVARIYLIAAFVSGLVTLALEVVWVHLLAQTVGTSVYAFGTMLFTFLVGLAWGSRRAERYADATDEVARRGLARAAVFGGGLVVITLPLWGLAPLAFEVAGPLVARNFYLGETVRFAVCFVLMIFPTVMLGMVLPLIIRCATGRAEGLGSGVGRIYAVNTLGAILGSIGMGFLLLPGAGSQRAIAFVALIALAMGWWLSRDAAWARGRRSGAILGGVAAAMLIVPVWSVSILNSGRNVYFNGGTAADGPPYFYREDVQGGVTSVIDYGGVRHMLTNGKFQGNAGSERAAQAGFALLPSLFVREQESALVIGLGTGMTTGVVHALGFEQVHVAELSQSVVDAARAWFADINHGVLEKENVTVHVNDGRNHLLLDERKHDLITIELTSIWFAGAGNLYNREFYELARTRMRPNAVFSQWIQLHHMRWDDLRVAIATMREVFPHVVFFRGEHQGLMVASGEPFAIDAERLARIGARPGVVEALALYDAPDLPSLIDNMLVDEAGITRLWQEAKRELEHAISTDDHPLVEYGTPRGNYWPSTEEENRARLRAFDTGVRTP